MLQNANASVAAPNAAAAAANNAAMAASSIQPKFVVIRRRPNQGFGFTLRHFIAYPPEDEAATWPQEVSVVVGGGGGLEPTSPTLLTPYQVKAMETIFIKEVQENGPAHYANLKTGDRVLMVNNTPIAGIAYSTIVSMIKQTPAVLTLHVVPKECDVLQMHYTSIAHTPESNRLTMTTAVAALPQHGSASILANGVGPGSNLAMATASSIKSFPQQQLISYPAVAASANMSSSSAASPVPLAPPLHGGSRSGSITSNASSTILQRHPALSGASSSLDFGDMAHSLRQHHHQQFLQKQLCQQQQGSMLAIQRGAESATAINFMRGNQPQSLSVLPGTAAASSSGSIVLVNTRQPKSPAALSQALYVANAGSSNGVEGDNSDLMIRLRESIKQKEEFLKSPVPATSNGNATHSAVHQQQHFFPVHRPQPVVATTCASVLRAPQQMRNNVGHKKQQQQQQQQHGAVACDMYNLYSGSKVVSRTPQLAPQRPGAVAVGNSNSKYAKDLDCFETLQETGVTNKVFERKLVSHMSKGFDPFKPLTINTSALESSGLLVKKPGVLFESVQSHPLHQMHHHQHHTSSTVDGQTGSRMEVHKATLANATIEPISSKYANLDATASSTEQSSNSIHTVAKLADIAESSAAAVVAAGGITAANVVRRFKPLSSSFDEGKPMRRISYLRATNNEADYHAVDPAGTVTGTIVTVPAIPEKQTAVEPHKIKELVEEHPDPTYDLVGGGHEFIETPNGLEDVRLSTLAVACAPPGSRRASINNDMRGSMLIDTDLNGKYVSSELEVFETEIEIKSSCINGKRMSEYRSWRQVKLEIKGDMLRIYSGRHGKVDHNALELDIRNFKFYDESVDKKKYVFRMQSKPSVSAAQLATLGNELNLDVGHEKVTASGSSAVEQEPQPSVAPYTEILFRTKSSNEMKRLFGLLQWKTSLNYDEQPKVTQPLGKQLAEPQKTPATATYLDDVAASASAADSSPISSNSGGIDMNALVTSLAVANTDSISPLMKTRKPASHKHVSDKDLGSPKSKNWKDLLFRRGGDGGRSSSGGSVLPGNASADLALLTACQAKAYGSIGVPLRACPMSKLNAHVPHLVEVCTNIVETKGLGVVGIYRIPGNKAAISELSELVNTKDFQFESCATDVRWEDVNVVSSLLKLFIRSLPDALMPASFYIKFIEADKKAGMERIVLLKDIVESLPRHPYETMKHLIRHLCRVSNNCEVNRMEPKNLAIIFGPSLIRTPNDTLETAVKDMKHQCRIVELLLTQYEYFFEDGGLPDLAELSGNAASNADGASGAGPNSALQQMQEDQTSMLLHNLSKIERIAERETRTSRFIPQLRRRTHGKRSGVSSDTYSGESVLSLDYAKVSTSSTTSTSSSATLQPNSSRLHRSGTSSKSASSTSSAKATTSPSSTAASSTAATTTSKKRSPGFLGPRSLRKASLDEKDSRSVDTTGSMDKEQHRSSVDISILLTDDDSSSRLSDTGSMSLTTITDTLDSKLRNLRSGSESNDENGSPEFPKNRRHTLGQPLHLHAENIPYADESPERLFHNFCPLDAPHSLMLSRSCTTTNTIGSTASLKASNKELKQVVAAVVALPPGMLKSHKLQHSATVPIHQGNTAPGSAAVTPTGSGPMPASAGGLVSALASPVSSGSIPLAVTLNAGSSLQRNLYTNKNLRFTASVAYERSCSIGGGAAGGSEDDSECSTTSDPKEKLLIATPAVFLERYSKKRRDHRLFRSASFNCRNYSTRHMNGANAANATQSCASSSTPATALTKDEKTDMNLTKKRQIQNKQNRSIKRRHTVGGPHDYAVNAGGHELVAINYNHHNRHHQQQLLKLGGNGAAAAETTTTTTTTTTVLRRIPSVGSPTAAGTGPGTGTGTNDNNVAAASSDSSCHINNSPQSDGSNRNGSSNNSSIASVGSSGGPANQGTAAGVPTANSGDHILEVGIRIKNINHSRY